MAAVFSLCGPARSPLPLSPSPPAIIRNIPVQLSVYSIGVAWSGMADKGGGRQLEAAKQEKSGRQSTVREQI